MSKRITAISKEQLEENIEFLQDQIEHLKSIRSVYMTPYMGDNPDYKKAYETHYGPANYYKTLNSLQNKLKRRKSLLAELEAFKLKIKDECQGGGCQFTCDMCSMYSVLTLKDMRDYKKHNA